MNGIVKFFRSLQGKLVMTYTLTTVLALLAIEIVVIGAGILLTGQLNSDTDNYIQDCAYYLAPMARAYLQPGKEDLHSLQLWLDGIYESGYASPPAQGMFDSPAAALAKQDPMYVLSPKGVVLAQAPSGENSLVGQAYTRPPANQAGANYYLRPDGSYLVEIPVHQELQSPVVVGTLVFTVKAPPPAASTFWPVLLGIVLFTGMLLLMGVAPFGMLFGFVMSRGLVKRLGRLTTAADSWSEGRFDVLPQDRSNDEIGLLGQRMRRMAERIQALLQARQELAMMEERNRLARELHDTVKQQTFATLMQVRAARNLVRSDPEAAEQQLLEAEALVKTSQQELSRMITELRPAALDGQGLPGALGQYLEQWSRQARIPAELTLSNQRALPLEVEQALYRVAQEGLSNVARHSRASAVALRLEYEPDAVRLVIRDNGVGFDPILAQKAGFGLQSMQDRMAAAGGTLEVASAAGEGTQLVATAPERPGAFS